AVNAGIESHEMVLGTLMDLKEHAEMMKRQSGVHHQSEANVAHVAPGNSGVVAWQFTKPGEFSFGYLVDDHFEKGMVGTIRVVAASEDEHGMHHAHPAPMPEMLGALGRYPMSRESSGTAWQPDASPHQGIHAMLGEWSTMTHGFVNLIYDDQGGPRGGTKTFSTSMLMVMAQRPLGEGTLGLRGMVSADALM